MQSLTKTSLDRFAAACIGRRIESIHLTREIGRGSRGIVFAGFQESLRRNVAVKIFPNAIGHGETTTIPARQEAIILSTLNHPNIIRLIGYGELDDCCYIVMPLFERGNLRDLIRRHNKDQDSLTKPMALSDSINIMLPILGALSFVHDHGLVHRDLKPSNILIDGRGTPCLADLGCAGSAGSIARAGSALYMSPEQAAGKALDIRSDIYSIGVILFEIAAGELPVGPESANETIRCKRSAPQKIFTERPRSTAPHLSEPLERIILKAIAAAPDDRYPDCRALAGDLVTLRTGEAK